MRITVEYYDRMLGLEILQYKVTKVWLLWFIPIIIIRQRVL